MKKTTAERKPAAMVRISPEVHAKMRKFLEESGLVQSRWVDRAILAAIPNGTGTYSSAETITGGRAIKARKKAKRNKARKTATAAA